MTCQACKAGPELGTTQSHFSPSFLTKSTFGLKYLDCHVTEPVFAGGYFKHWSYQTYMSLRLRIKFELVSQQE